MQQTEEAATEAEPEGDRALRLEAEAGVVEVKLLHRFAQGRVVDARDGVDAGEDEALGGLVARQRLRGGSGDGGDGVADLGIADALEACGHVTDVAGPQLRHRDELRPEETEFEEFRLGAGTHEPHDVVLAERPLGHPNVNDHALVDVVVRVEDETLNRPVRITLRRRDPGHERLEDLHHARAILGRCEQDLLARHRQDAFQLLDDHVHLRRRQVDLVDDRDDRQILLEREVDVGQRLGLDPLSRVHHEDRALARLERPADFVAEVDVSGRVDEIEPIHQAVVGRVLQADRPGLDRDALLFFEVHRIEDLTRHLTRVNRVRQLE